MFVLLVLTQIMTVFVIVVNIVVNIVVMFVMTVIVVDNMRVIIHMTVTGSHCLTVVVAVAVVVTAAFNFKVIVVIIVIVIGAFIRIPGIATFILSTLHAIVSLCIILQQFIRPFPPIYEPLID